MSNDIPEHLLHSADFRRRLDNAKFCATNGREGEVYFLQASKTPLVSCFITTGQFLNKTVNERSVDLRFVYQHAGYPLSVRSNKESEDLGYKSFQTALENDTFEDISDQFKELTKSEYSLLFEETCVYIDTCISANHGIRCYTDGDIKNKSNTNNWFLHVCDMLNILYERRGDCIPKVVVKSTLLDKLPSKKIVNDLDSKNIPLKNRNFMMLHVDYFYICYGYFGNYSFVPIRTQVDKESKVFHLSSFFSNDDHFMTHQKGKLQELNQNEKGALSRMMYKSV